MNREIKFRAWDLENEYMISSKQGVFTALQYSMNITKQDNGYYGNGDLLKPIKNKYILMEYTGLKDKNGKRIFEGDRVKAKFFGKNVEGEIGFCDGCFLLWNSSVSDNQLFIFNDIEVIGNIYERNNEDEN